MTKGKSKSKSRALVLSLVDSGGGGNNDDVGQPLPLDVYDPCSHSVTLRRSPRFRPLPSETHNVAPHNRKSRPKSGRDFKTRLRRSRRLNRSSGNGSLENSLSLVLDKRSLRRSPRLLGNGNAGVEKVVHVLVQDKCDNRKGKRVLSRNSEEKGIQKWSPRLASASSLTSLPGEFEMKSQSLKMKSQRNERQSMIVRLYCTEEQTKGCWKESQQNVPAEFESKQLSLTWHEHDDKETLPISCYISTVCNSGQPSKRNKFHPENYDLEMVDDNFWRQASRISNSASGAVNENLNRSSIELPKSAKMKPLMNSGRQCLSEKINLLALKEKQNKHIALLIGDPVPSDEAQDRWRWRYDHKSQRSNRPRPALGDVDEDKIVWNVECHYTQAEIDGSVLNLGDCVYVKGEGEQRHIGRIVEFFKTTDGEDYFRIQWFYRAEDTVMKDESAFHDKKRLFYSTIMNDNPIDCIISKATVVQTSSRIRAKSRLVSACDFYFDMEYCLDYSTFRTLPMELSNNSLEIYPSTSYKAKLVLLDLFSGCGGMSTGLCLGAKVSCIDLVMRWAVDSDKSACESLNQNHPETYVRNEAAEDFLELLKGWERLCKRYAVNSTQRAYRSRSMDSRLAKENNKYVDRSDIPPGEYEVLRLIDICYGDPDKTGKHGLKFKVRWKGYSASEDTWEPFEALSNCQESVRDFVRNGFKAKILPLPGDVDVICGGPPCQGISGYNRHRNTNSPLKDERNRQIVVFMDIVRFLKPKFVLMENVVDILRFDKASLARYALSRLVHMKYQARIGTMAAGCYGLPQFRLRVFLWGADPSEILPQFPLPTHDVIVRYWPPPEFERNTVAYDEDHPHDLEKAIVLEDAISDLSAVTSYEAREKMPHKNPPKSEFQRYLRATCYEMTGIELNGTRRADNILYDHRPYVLGEEDYARVCQIPKRKGANFRDLPGVIVGSNNVARRDPTKEQIIFPSGRPLVPDFALNFEQGKSKRPYARLWWDETVSTIVTCPDLHCQAVIHPEQDRVLTIRECARLQGFPDYYRFCGTVKERYRQVGNAVAVPVARALGYCLGMAFQRVGGDEPLLKLPPKFSHSSTLELFESLFQKD